MLVFLLSPAYCGGRRARIALNPKSESVVARHLREGQLDLGAAFAFFSGLYFRGKLGYATAFGRSTLPGVTATQIITPTRGLMPPETIVSAGLIEEFASVDV